MPTKPPKPKQDDPKQSKRFVETAKEIGADENPKAFEKAFKKVTAKRPS
jgi:hypothetical protein